MTGLKTLLIITVSTARLFFPGIPAQRGMPETAKQPAVRSISIELASDAAATTTSKISVDLPAGLKSGATVPMQLDPNAHINAAPTDADTKTKVLEYWGIGREVAGDQPHSTTSGAAQAEINAVMEKLPEKSYAFWPLPDAKRLDQTASAQGVYTFKSDCCGSTSITLGKDQDFLDPVNVTAADRDPDLTKPIVIRWNPVPNAAGYLLRAYGGNEKQTISWTSSVKPELTRGIEYRPLSREETDKMVKDGVLIPSYVASATIPAGIFKDSMSVVVVMTAIGRDLVQTKDGIETRVLVRSTAAVPIFSSPYQFPKIEKKADEKKEK